MGLRQGERNLFLGLLVKIPFKRYSAQHIMILNISYSKSLKIFLMKKMEKSHRKTSKPFLHQNNNLNRPLKWEQPVISLDVWSKTVFVYIILFDTTLEYLVTFYFQQNSSIKLFFLVQNKLLTTITECNYYGMCNYWMCQKYLHSVEHQNLAHRYLYIFKLKNLIFQNS